MTTTHTPGPWQSSEMTMIAKDWAALNRGKLNIVVRGSDVIAAVWCGDDRNTTEAANARLIAAAPDMIEALRQAEVALASELDMRNAADDVQDAKYHVPVAPALEAVRAAIAKAEGRS